MTEDAVARENHTVRREIIETKEGRAAADVLYVREGTSEPEPTTLDEVEPGRLYREIFANSVEGIAILDATGTYVEQNATHRALTGFCDEELVGRTPAVHLGDAMFAQIARALTEHGRWRGEVTSHPKHGEPNAIELSAFALRDPHGRVTGYVTYLRLERTRAEEALRAAHATFHHLVEHSPFGVYAVNADFRLVLVSAGAQKVFENVRPLIGRDFAEVLRTIWPEPFASEAIGRFRHTLETGESYHSPRTVEERHDIGAVESYDWKIERIVLPDGRPGVVCHFYDLSDRQRYEAALREADRQKDEFLAMLAHELRNPLAPIRTAVSLLQARGPSDPVLVRSRDVIARQAAQMARLLEDLLDVSRLSRGQLTLRRTLVPLGDLIEAAIETSRPVMEERRQHLEVRGHPAALQLDVDPTRITQVFANLLNNASKYSERGSTIYLEIERDGDEAAVHVRDTGIGIEPEMLERVFDLFAQSAGARAHAPGGVGVGLSLARRLVELHEGRITAASGGAGQGSEFVVRLPLATAPPGDRAAPPVPERAVRVQRRVLVVDDNVDAADMMSALLDQFGCEARAVYDGLSAVEVAASFRPEMVLLDLGMATMDGYEVCRRLRSEPWGREMTIVAVSGWGQEDDRQRTSEAGFDRHLIKPVDPAVLVEVIGAVRPA